MTAPPRDECGIFRENINATLRRRFADDVTNFVQGQPLVGTGSAPEVHATRTAKTGSAPEVHATSGTRPTRTPSSTRVRVRDNLPVAAGCVRSRKGQASSAVKKARAGQSFLITVSARGEQSKVAVHSAFSDFGELDCYCVGLERGSSVGQLHAHGVFKFKTPVLLEQIKAHLISVSSKYDLDLTSMFDLQACRSVRNALKYCSKEDDCPLFHCPVSHLSFRFQCIDYCRTHSNFSVTDAFVVNHMNSYRFIHEFFNAYKQNKGPYLALSPCYQAYDNWTLFVGKWWNNVVYNINNKRKSALYLHGPTAMGKTTFIERLLGGRGYGSNVYHPEPGKFCFMDLMDNHEVVLFEEYADEHWRPYYGKLKRLIEGKAFTVDVKGMNPRTIIWNGIVIFVSNFNNINDDALLNRLTVVYADRYAAGAKKVWVPEEKFTPPIQEENQVPETEVIDLTD